MSAAIDTNVLVRVLVQDPTAAAQCAAAKRVVADASASGEPLLVTLCVLLETEWVLRSRYKVDRALERVGMSAYRHRQIGELSGGQKKRVFLARSLAQEGKIILLDEPFTGIDVKTETAIIGLLRELRASGHLMLVSTHNLGSVPDFCDRVVLINRTVLAAGPTDEVFTQKNLERAFGGVLRNFELGGRALHDDDDARSVTVLTDDERPLVFYGDKPEHRRTGDSKTDKKQGGE